MCFSSLLAYYLSQLVPLFVFTWLPVATTTIDFLQHQVRIEQGEIVKVSKNSEMAREKQECANAKNIVLEERVREKIKSGKRF